MASPAVILHAAIRAVPAVKYALGIGGLVATVAIIYSFKLDPRVAFFGTLLMLLLMSVLVIFARMASLAGPRLLLPAQIMTWFSLLLFMVVSATLFSSVFFRQPLDLSSWLTPPQAQKRSEPTQYPSCRLAEFGVERWLKTEEIGQSSGWRGGGRSQQDWCNDLIGILVQSRSTGPEHAAEVLQMSERSKKDWQGHASYNYYCKVRLSWQPLYIEKQDPKCGDALDGATPKGPAMERQSNRDGHSPSGSGDQLPSSPPRIAGGVPKNLSDAQYSERFFRPCAPERNFYVALMSTSDYSTEGYETAEAAWRVATTTRSERGSAFRFKVGEVRNPKDPKKRLFVIFAGHGLDRVELAFLEQWLADDGLTAYLGGWDDDCDMAKEVEDSRVY